MVTESSALLPPPGGPHPGGPHGNPRGGAGLADRPLAAAAAGGTSFPQTLPTKQSHPSLFDSVVNNLAANTSQALSLGTASHGQVLARKRSSPNFFAPGAGPHPALSGAFGAPSDAAPLLLPDGSVPWVSAPELIYPPVQRDSPRQRAAARRRRYSE